MQKKITQMLVQIADNVKWENQTVPTPKAKDLHEKVKNQAHIAIL